MHGSLGAATLNFLVSEYKIRRVNAMGEWGEKTQRKWAERNGETKVNRGKQEERVEGGGENGDA